MASISYNTVTSRLEEIGKSTSAEELIFELLRLFGSVTETSIERIKEGKGNLSKDGVTIMPKFGTPKRVVAYRAVSGDLQAELENLKSDAKIAKHSPRLLIVSDGVKILAYDPKSEEEYDNDVALMHKDYDFFMPLAGVERFQNIEENEADVKASYIMARIYDDIKRYNDISSDAQIHALNIFLTRLLFCFFAEDTGIFSKDLFSQSIHDYTLEDGSDLAEYIEGAFDIMNIESPAIRDRMPSKISQFPYVNGGLFAQHFAIPHLSARTRKLILKCGAFNWSEINPDIFGSMIQAVIRPEDRAGLGLHYTSVPNIMKVIRPLFLDELYEAFNSAKDSVKELDKLLLRLSKIKFFDPACGSGNFLIIAYKELRRLENQIWLRIIELNHGFGLLPFSNITLTQFYGIEIDEFAQETATLSLWLAEHQMNKQFSDKFHITVSALPLKASGHIVHGNACRLDWNNVCPHSADDEVYVMGNPPYLGSKLQSVDQREDMRIALNGIREYKSMDYIAAWFYKGAEYLQNSKTKIAFVSTNSICQGEQVAMLWHHIYDMNATIFFAYTSFKWGNNAKYNAGVTCAIIGLSNKYKGARYLYSNNNSSAVDNINPYLASGGNTVVVKTSKIQKGLPKMCFGCMPYDNGNLIISQSERDNIISMYPESATLIKQLVGSQEFIRGEVRYCLWISDENLQNALNNPFIAERIQKTANFRLNGCKDKDAGAELAKRAHQFREHIELTDSIIVPRVSSERREYIPMGFLDKNTVISDSAFAIYDAQLWLFGILTSKMHMAWVRAVGGKLEERLRYSATLCYNTFPFPKITKEQKKELESYAEEVILTREESSELTLAQMYDPETMPQRLRDAHRALDLAVERCYRPEPFTSDEERLEHLFNLYEKMTKK